MWYIEPFLSKFVGICSTTNNKIGRRESLRSNNQREGKCILKWQYVEVSQGADTLLRQKILLNLKKLWAQNITGLLNCLPWLAHTSSSSRLYYPNNIEERWMLCADSITGLCVLQRFIQCISSYIYTYTWWSKGTFELHPWSHRYAINLHL